MKTTLPLLFAVFALGCEPEPLDSDTGLDVGTDTGVDTEEDTDLDTDTDTEPDTDADTTPVTRTTLSPGFCPQTPTAPGAYEGTLAANLNDISSADCIGTAPGRDGAVRVELAPGETLSATYNSTSGDAILYILDNCPVITSCLDGADESATGPETVAWTNDGSQTNPVYIVLDNAELATSGPFILDFSITEGR